MYMSIYICMHARVSSLCNTAAPRSQDWICIGKKQQSLPLHYLQKSLTGQASTANTDEQNVPSLEVSVLWHLSTSALSCLCWCLQVSWEPPAGPWTMEPLRSAATWVSGDRLHRNWVWPSLVPREGRAAQPTRSYTSLLSCSTTAASASGCSRDNRQPTAPGNVCHQHKLIPPNSWHFSRDLVNSQHHQIGRDVQDHGVQTIPQHLN